MDVWQEMGNFERAMTNFQTAVRLKPSLHQALNNLGVLFTMQVRASLTALCSAFTLNSEPCLRLATLRASRAAWKEVSPVGG